MSAEYTVTKPEPLYVESERTAAVLCKTATFPCSGGSSGAFGVGTPLNLVLKQGTLFTFKAGTEAYAACSEVRIAGKVMSEAEIGVDVSGKVSEFAFGNCTHPITVTERGSFSISYTSGKNGVLTLEGFEFGDPTWLCTQKGPESFALFGGSMGRATVNSALVNQEGICPHPLIWSGEFIVAAPEPLYVSEL